MEALNNWEKNKPTDKIWWLNDPNRIGEWIFSFDRIKRYNMFSDYPEKLTHEQKMIFDKENPKWAEFFNDRV